MISDYIIAIHTRDIESNETIFDIKYITLNISTDSGESPYKYDDLYGLIKGFEYSKSSRTIKQTNGSNTSCAVINLSNILQKYITSRKLWISVNTNQGNIKFKIRG